MKEVLKPSEIKWYDLVHLNRHQVFTGAVNPGDNCYSVGYLNTTSFIVYGSGTNLVILTCNLETLQIIPGIKYGNIQVGCVECSSSEGMIAASYAHHIYLFKPKSIDGKFSFASRNEPGNIKWHEIGFFQLESFVSSLSWNPDGTQLLTAAAERIQLWKAAASSSAADTQADWCCAWQYRSPNPISRVKFSPNGHYFATVGKEDCFVKIWYKQLYTLPQHSTGQLYHEDDCNEQQAYNNSTAIYNYVYIAHPCTVTGFSWRTTSHLMPKDAVLSYLLTSCRDNKCRIWAETSDSLRRHHVSLTLSCNVEGLASASYSPSKWQSASSQLHSGRIPDDSSGYEARSEMGANEEFVHVEQLQQQQLKTAADMAYGNPSRFHLVSVINPQTDIPSSVGTVLNGEVPDSSQFAVHWLNNKAFHFNLQAEIIFRYLHRKFKQQQTQSGGSHINDAANTPSSSKSRRSSAVSAANDELVSSVDNLTKEEEVAPNKVSEGVANEGLDTGGKSLIRIAITLFGDILDGRNEKQQQSQSLRLEPVAVEGFSEVLKNSLPHWLKEWETSCDMVFSIHPIDGSLLLWKIDSLDEHSAGGSYRHPQIAFASRIPNAFPASDAISCSNNLLMYRAALSEDIEKFLKLKFEHQMSNPFILTNQNFASGLFAPNVVILSKHSDGSLNQWEVSFDANSKYSSLQTVSHLCRVSGHRFHMVDLKNHPSLPLLITVSHHNVPKMMITDSYLKEKTTESSGKRSRKGKGLVSQMSFMESSLEESVREANDVLTEDLSAPHGLCSELILWRVDPVGPLSQSGGLLELARVQSPSISAFCTASWIPTLLPSHVLGPVSRSPSVSFVAFDGNCLRVYQSIIDAQPLLTKLAVLKGSPVRTSKKVTNAVPNLNVVSQQSTNQPACIIELDQLEHSEFLKNYFVKLFHVFKYEEFVSVTQSRKASRSNSTGFNEFNFDEKFVLVAIAKSPHETAENIGWQFFTWVIRIFISDPQPFDSTTHSSRSSKSMPIFEDDLMMSAKTKSTLLTNPIQNLVRVSSTFEGSQDLDIGAANVESASVAELGAVSKVLSSATDGSGQMKEHLYQVVTAVDDKRVLFWNCRRKNGKFSWTEWNPSFANSKEANVKLDAVPVSVTCANFGRIALAYKIQDPSNGLLSVKVDVLENESSGGATWVLEHSIETPKAKSPNMAYGTSVADLKAGTSRSLLANSSSYKDGNENDLPPQKQKTEPLGRISSFYRKTRSPKTERMHTTRQATKSSESKIQKVYLDLQENDKRDREFVHVSWVPKYDGSYLLCVCTGARVIVYSSFTSSPGTTQSNTAAGAMKSASVIKSKSSYRKWVPIAYVNISTSDELSPFPVLMSSCANGILILGLMNEMQIFSQWTSKRAIEEREQLSNSQEEDTPKAAQERKKSVLDETSRIRGSIQSANASIKGSLSSLSVNSFINDNNIKKQDETDAKVSENETKCDDAVLIDPGIFEKSRALNPVLPQYHPKLLIGLLNFGKTARVKAILAHLVKTLVGEEAVGKAIVCGDLEEEEKTDAIRTRRATFSRSMTVHNGAPGAGPGTSGSRGGGGGEWNMSGGSVETVPPLPLYTLIQLDSIRSSCAQGPPPIHATNTAASDDSSRNHRPNGHIDNSSANGSAKADKYDALFETSVDESDEFDTALNVDLDFSLETDGLPKRRKSMAVTNLEAVAAAMANIGPTYFGPAQSRLLAQCLVKLQLPELSRADQMQLLAVAQVVSTISSDSALQAQGTDSSMTTDTIDDCGMRYVMGLKLHQFITKASGQSLLSSPPLDAGLFAWAHLSESEDQMIAALRHNATWQELKKMGVGWWVTNLNTLRLLIERVARQQFQANKDPMDSAIFFIAMQKKHVLRGLFKSVGDEKMTKFFSKDFSTDDNKRVALKNAFALNSKQRFEHAAAFFLLAGKLQDAVQVCVKKLEDIQLAIVISRLHEEELEFSSCAKQILRQHVINPTNKGFAAQNLESKNPFLKCISHWWLREYSSALCALVESCTSESSQNISVFNFYNYLRKHPMILRRHILKIEQVHERSVAGQSVLLTQHTGVQDTKGEKTTSLIEVSREERLLFFKTATDHFTNGCPLLALEVLTIIPPVRKDDLDLNASLDVNQINKKRALLRSGTIEGKQKETKLERAEDFDWGFAAGSQKSAPESGMIDWGAPVATSNGGGGMGGGFDLNFDLNFDDVLRIDGEDLEETTITKPIENGTDSVFTTQSESAKTTAKIIEQVQSTDLYSIYLKQEACLKIFVEELRTLAMAIDCDESHLRAYFRLWLEKIGALLDSLCNQKSDIQLEINEECLDNNAIEDCLSPDSESNFLFQVDVEKKLAKAIQRKAWLKYNESLLNTLLGYSSLFGCNGGGLSCVRMELILLLQELQQNYSKKQILSPLPFPNSLPLISACLAPVQTVVVNPFNSLERFCQDLVKTLTSYTTPPQSPDSYKVAITLRNLCGALSSCIYQSLQDSNKVSMTGAKKSPDTQTSNPTHALSDPKSSKVGELYARNYSEERAASVLVTSRRTRNDSNLLASHIISKPSDWPGVKLFIRLLSDYAHLRNSGSESRLRILLVESCCVVYTGILFHALVTNDANELLRVIANPVSSQMFAFIAGGCVRTRSHASNVMLPPQDAVNLMKNSTASKAESAAHLAANRHRISLNAKILAKAGGSLNDDSPPSPVIMNEENKYQYETFSSPVMTIFDFILSKPNLPSTMDFMSYESDEEEADMMNRTIGEYKGDGYCSDESEEEDDGFGFRRNTAQKEVTRESVEHSDPNSYSWCIMRFAIITSVLDTLNSFILEMGLELSELALHSPTLQNLRNTITQWQNVAHTQLSLMAANGPPDNFISRADSSSYGFGTGAASDVASSAAGTASLSTSSIRGVHQVRASARPTANDLFHPDATPFRSNSLSVQPVKRLWCYLVRQKRLENLFFHYCFAKSGEQLHGNQLTIPSRNLTKGFDSPNTRTWDQFEIPVNPVAVVYRDVSNETISALCFNNIPLTLSHSIHCLVVATQKDITENDITNIVCPPAPSSGSTLAMLGKTKGSQQNYSRGSSDLSDQSSMAGGYSNSIGLFSHRKGNSLKRSYATNVRKLCCHPYLPFYLSGCSYGKLNLWEWGHEEVVAMFKTSNSKITGLNFNADGRKLGVCDESGNLHLYHTSYGGLQQSFQRPFLSLECHTKQCAGFSFIGCSSLVATVGTGLGAYNPSSSTSGGPSGFSFGGSGASSAAMSSICMWDCLMPTHRNSNLISVYQGGSSSSDSFCSVTYSASTRAIIAGTGKGEVLLYDTRQRRIQASLPAFTHSQSQVKCLALDPLGNLLAAGSRDGDIKVFDLSSSNVVFHSEGEHKRKDGLFKTGPRGVLDLQILSSGDHMLSCGSDGAVKLRKLTNCATPISQYLL